MIKPFNQSWRLALTYLGIIMTLSLVFSGIIYALVSSQLGRPLPPPSSGQSLQRPFDNSLDTQSVVDQRNSETLSSLIVSLIILNSLMLMGGSWFSYYMARRTLRPMEAAMRAQTQFVGDASHELRTPLTALLAINEVTLRKKHIDSAKMHDTLQKNIVEINKLRELTEALLGLAHAGQGPARAQKVWLDAIVTESIESVSTNAAQKMITITSGVPHIESVLHTASIKQILTILLDNAVKYSPDNSMVTVCSRVKSHSISLSVTDEGMGIKVADRTKIFERFYRSDAARTRTGTSGHGLGLAIAKATAERYGYKISLESTDGKGSIFTVTLSL